MEPCRGSDPGSNPGSGVSFSIPVLPGFSLLITVRISSVETDYFF